MILAELQDLKAQGLITLRPNDSGTLFIANYTPKVQYDKLWTSTLMKCRGLIVDAKGDVIATPFPKFFNIEEHQPEEIPSEPFEVFEKLDGSLGIAYRENGMVKIATRGSFNSDQAIKGTQLIHSEQYRRWTAFLHPAKTYLFEIIYPENRIVCNYGDQEKLALLAIINPDGTEQSIDDHCWPDKAKKYDGITDLSKIKDFEDSENEGFVIKFKSGMRVKSKFSEYVRLHRIITQVSAKTIWEYLRDGKNVNDLLDRVPDEFYKWVRSTAASIMDDYMQIDSCARSEFYDAPKCETRKDFADYALTKVFPGLLFKLYDGKPIAKEIWKLVKPQYEKPFKTEV